jgi:3'-phosphoadenosine 5'-phosphosulfate (PAPS) 3'-phosphatase
MDERSERIQRRFDLPVMVAALLTIPLIVIEESNYGQPWGRRRRRHWAELWRGDPLGGGDGHVNRRRLTDPLST